MIKIGFFFILSFGISARAVGWEPTPKDAIFIETHRACRAFRLMSHIQKSHNVFKKELPNRQFYEKKLLCQTSIKTVESYAAQQKDPILRFIAQQIAAPALDGSEQRILRSLDAFELKVRSHPNKTEATYLTDLLARCLVLPNFQREVLLEYFRLLQLTCNNGLEKIKKPAPTSTPAQLKLYQSIQQILVPEQIWYESVAKTVKTTVPVKVTPVDVTELTTRFPVHLKDLQVVNNIEGLRLTKVEKRSIWDRLGLRAGDQIHYIQERKISHLSDLVTAYIVISDAKFTAVRVILTRNQTLIALRYSK